MILSIYAAGLAILGAIWVFATISLLINWGGTRNQVDATYVLNIVRIGIPAILLWPLSLIYGIHLLGKALARDIKEDMW